MRISVAVERIEAILPRTERDRLALGWSLAVLAVVAATAPAVGVSRYEGDCFVAAESYARFVPDILRAPQQPSAIVQRDYGVGHDQPALAKELYGLTHAVLSRGLRIASHAQGFRFGAFLFAALLTWVLVLFAWDLAGRGAALLAPALFWLVPGHFHHAHLAALDVPVTAMWLATVYAYWKSLAGRCETSRYIRYSMCAGLLFGAAVSVKHDGWLLAPLLFLHWVAAYLGGLRCGSQRERVRPLAFACMAVLGPLVLVGTWPWLWQHTLDRAREYAAFHLRHENHSWTYLGQVLRTPPFPVVYPFVVTALTVPLASLAAMTGGLAQGAARLGAALRRRSEDISVCDELLLLLAALFPLCFAAWPTAPHFGGVERWLPAMPPLAILGARALVTTGRTLWPTRQGAVTAALAFFVLAPALWAVVHAHPFGTAAYGELAGGTPGAASLGMQRQPWGDNMGAALAALNRHAVPGARIWFQEAASTTVSAYQRDGGLRPDLRRADGPEEADISVWHYHYELIDQEFSTWAEFGTARPVYGVYLDEVPLIQVYARAGAWR